MDVQPSLREWIMQFLLSIFNIKYRQSWKQRPPEKDKRSDIHSHQSLGAPQGGCYGSCSELLIFPQLCSRSQKPRASGTVSLFRGSPKLIESQSWSVMIVIPAILVMLNCFLCHSQTDATTLTYHRHHIFPNSPRTHVRALGVNYLPNKWILL